VANVKAVEKLNRNKLAGKKGGTLGDLASTRKAPAEAKTAPEKTTKKEGLNPETRARRRFLIVTTTIARFGKPEDMEKAAGMLLPIAQAFAVKAGSSDAGAFAKYVAEAPARLIPADYKAWRENGKAAKAITG
jgi:hypothetical protein